jgi:inosine/xanthosine triphosphate pyrophosphatase family protein/shikimate kinase
MERIDIRDAFLRLPRQLQVTFFTSSRQKFAQASTIFKMSGAQLSFRRHDDQPYGEDYSGNKEQLLTEAVAEVRRREGGSAIFFIEDTSIRIEALSRDADFPGLKAKEWFEQASHEETVSSADLEGSRGCSVESCIALSLPGLLRPIFFYGLTIGQLVSQLPGGAANLSTPWLDPRSFSGWFIPDGATRTLGEMSLEESFEFDFRAKSLLLLLDRLEELTAALNAGPGSYGLLRQFEDPANTDLQPSMFELPEWIEHRADQVIVVVGPTCSGKTTFGVQISHDRVCHFVDASSLVRRRRQAKDLAKSIGDFASEILDREGFDMVAREIQQLYGASDAPLVVTGLRTIEEIQHMRTIWPRLTLVSLHAPQRVRYQRFVDRASREELSFSEFQIRDEQQAELGLLPVADELADFIVENTGSLDEFVAAARGIAGLPGGGARGVTRVGSRLSPEESQLYRCLAALRREGRALTTQEISAALGGAILHNNANKILKRYSALAARCESRHSNVRYEITGHGLAFLNALEDLQRAASS